MEVKRDLPVKQFETRDAGEALFVFAEADGGSLHFKKKAPASSCREMQLIFDALTHVN